MKAVEWFCRHRVGERLCYLPRDPDTAGASVPLAEAQSFGSRWIAEQTCVILNEMLHDGAPLGEPYRWGSWEVVEG